MTGSSFIFLGMCHTIDFATNSANLLFMHKHLLACMNHEYLPHDDLLGFQSCMRGIVSNNTSTYWYNQLWLSCMLHKKAADSLYTIAYTYGIVPCHVSVTVPVSTFGSYCTHLSTKMNWMQSSVFIRHQSFLARMSLHWQSLYDLVAATANYVQAVV